MTLNKVCILQQIFIIATTTKEVIIIIAITIAIVAITTFITKALDILLYYNSRFPKTRLFSPYSD